MNFFSSTTQPSTRRGVYLLLALTALNLTVGAVALLIGTQYPVLLGLTLLAWGLGLRHAMDADHIAAIDNATRRLLYRGRPSVGVGFFFSLGHSTVVILLSLAIIGMTLIGADELGEWKEVGKAIGVTVSSVFLLAIGSLNLIVLKQLVIAWKNISRGGQNTYHGHMHIGGPIEKIFGPLVKLVDRSYKMYIIGFLFGLGFDTASEIGLLALSVVAMGSVNPWATLLLPMAFMAGMTLLDTLNSLLMLGIYSWGGVTEKPRLAYNIGVTGLSAFSALTIGITVGLQFLSVRLNSNDGIFAVANSVSLDKLGYVMISLFATSWIIALIYIRRMWVKQSREQSL